MMMMIISREFLVVPIGTNTLGTNEVSTSDGWKKKTHTHKEVSSATKKKKKKKRK